MDGKCKTIDAVYNCRVTSPELRKIYFWLAVGEWKKRCYNHKRSFNHKRYLYEKTLSNCMWYLKETLNVTPNLKWSLVRCVTPY